MTPSPYDVRLERLANTPLAVVRREVSSGQLAKVVPELCGVVWNFVRAHNLKGGRNVALYWDGKITLEVGVELADAFEGDGNVIRSGTPAGPTAVATHFGPYGQLGGAHEAIHAWCQKQGRRLAGPSWEIYGHWQKEWDTNPAAIRTDVYYLVEG